MTTLMKRNGLNLLTELPSVFSDPFFRDWLNWSNSSGNNVESGTLPAVNIRETDQNYEISVAAPGMSKNDFKVELNNNQLVISGEKRQENEQKEDNYLRREFSYQSFARTFTLAEKQVSGDKIQAKYADGILHITIPKSEEAKTKPARVIPVN